MRGRCKKEDFLWPKIFIKTPEAWDLRELKLDPHKNVSKRIRPNRFIIQIQRGKM